MFCKNCGTENVDGAKFCRACGAPQEQAAPAANQGYAPNQGYVPNRAPVRKNNAAGKTDIMKLIPTIAGVVALICMFLPWYVISVWGVSESATLIGMAFDFDSWEVGFSGVLLSLLSLGCIACAVFTVFASTKKLPVGKIVAAVGAVLAIFTLFASDALLDAMMKGMSEYGSAGFAFYLYIVAMAAAAVVGFLNEKK